MTRSIEEYLKALRVELEGCDPALIQDALYDAEEFLQSGLEAFESTGGENALSAVIERYGMPEEVASAYREIEGRSTPASYQPKEAVESREVPTAPTEPLKRVSFFGVFLEPRAYASLFYMLLSLGTGIIYFTWVVAGLSLSISLLILIIGIPIALLFLATTRAISLVEGWLIEALLGVRMPRRPRSFRDEGSWLDRIKMWFSDYRTWTTLLYMILMLPLGIVYFTVVVVLLSLSMSLVIAPVVQLFLGHPVIWAGPWGGYWIEVWMFPFFMVIGALLMICTLHIARWIGRVHGLMAKTLLVGSL
ncbi:sensor domain-containing protein [Gemmatimonadota bacterium]